MLIHYNENLSDLIKRKLEVYADATLQNRKEEKMRVFLQLEAIKETLATMNIDLIFNYDLFLATMFDLTNNTTIEID